MSENDDDASQTSLSADEAVSLIANEARLGIIRALGEAYTEEGPTPGVTWSELREQVAPSMDSGQFNYHLDKLVGPFVKRTDDGYRLRLLGMQLYRPLAAASFDGQAKMEPVDLDQSCYFCDGHLTGRHSDGTVAVQCNSCEYLYEALELPSHVIETKEPLTVLRHVDRCNRQYLLAYSNRICPHCAGRVEADLYQGEDVSYDQLTQRNVLIYAACTNCPSRMYLPVGEWVLYHPALVTFCYQRGIDVIERPLWELAFTATDRGVTVESTDPWEVTFQIERQGETFQMILNEDIEVTDVTIT